MSKSVLINGALSTDDKEWLTSNGFFIVTVLNKAVSYLCLGSAPINLKLSQEARTLGVPFTTIKKLKDTTIVATTPTVTETVKPAIKKAPKFVTDQLWVDLFKPQTPADLIGNKACVDKLTKFLTNHNQETDFGSMILIFGQPGLGKSCSAQVIAESLNYSWQELNASDCRKSADLEEALLAPLYGRHILGKKLLLIMEEVDGMDGDSDRGGIQTFLKMVKSSPWPVILTCNNVNHKLKTLKSHVKEHLEWKRPLPSQIIPRLKSIIRLSKSTALMSWTDDQLTEFIQRNNCDIRHCIHELQMSAFTPATRTNDEGKDTHMSAPTFDSIKTLFKSSKPVTCARTDLVQKIQASGLSFDELKHLPDTELFRRFKPYSSREVRFQLDQMRKMHDSNCKKDELNEQIYFQDMSSAPLWVQQNWTNLDGSAQHDLDLLCQVSDLLSTANLVQEHIQSRQDYDLMPNCAALSVVEPTKLLSAVHTGKVDFPQEFARMSRGNRLKRSLLSIQENQMKYNSSARNFRLDCLEPLQQIQHHILNHDQDVDKAVEFMQHDVNLIQKDLWSELMEIKLDTDELKDPIPTKIKTAFTKKMNTMNEGLTKIKVKAEVKSEDEPKPKRPKKAQKI